jgi:hypothetical protein
LPIDCVWFDEPPDDGKGWRPGWCFPLGYRLSKRYLEHVAPHRKPISVCLPFRGSRLGGATPFCIDSHPTDQPDGAWIVTIVGLLVHGAKPDITVSPSIHAVGLYHGFLQHGTLTDDLDG